MGESKTSDKKQKPTLYKCYKWYLEYNSDDEELKKRGCPAHMIESMHILHAEIVSGKSHSNTLKNRKIGAHIAKRMELLYKGTPKKNTRVAAAYKMLIEGYTESQMREEGIKKEEIELSKKFRDEYENRDILRSSLAIELWISRGLAQKLQDTVRSRVI